MHRSLNASQRAMIAVGFLEYESQQANARMVLGVKSTDPMKNFRYPETQGEASDKAGERMGVSGRSVSEADRVRWLYLIGRVVAPNAPASLPIDGTDRLRGRLFQEVIRPALFNTRTV